VFVFFFFFFFLCYRAQVNELFVKLRMYKKAIEVYRAPKHSAGMTLREGHTMRR